MTPEQHSALVERICESKHFRRANKLKAFLRHICEKTFEGQAEELKEHEVGTEVFGRKLGYNMAEDNIVRVQARLLRNRLERYFEDEGRAEPTLVRVPRGGYVPEFIERASLESAPGEAVFPKAAAAPELRRRPSPLLLVAAGAALPLGAAAWEVVRPGRPAGELRTADLNPQTRDL